ncbi:MAG: hypothetical protein KR126chlam3_01693 [Chlamydiae bacterium]|nr:hypothetical protein [Chlamydiota bacterium]
MVDRLAEIQTQQQHSFGTINPTENKEMFQQMEETNEALAPYLDILGNEPTRAEMIDPQLAEQALDTVNDLRELTGQAPISNQSILRRLHALLARIAEATERHVLFKKDQEHEKKEKIEGKVGSIRSQTQYQGWVYTVFGFGNPFLLLAGGMIGGNVGEVVKGLANLTQPGAQALDKFLESGMVPDRHAQQLFQSTVSSDRQALEGLKNLPEQVQRKIAELISIEGQMIRSTGQRG